MIKKYKLLFVVLLIFTEARTQSITINLNEPTSPTTSLSNIFNFTLINSGSLAYNMQWNGSVFRGTQLVARGSSQTLQVSQGVMQCNTSTANFQFNGLDMNSIYQDLTFGHYKICIDVNIIFSGGGEQILDECTEFDVVPLTPPFLIYPFDGSVINEPNPMLQWSAPAPNNITNEILYRLKLVELLPNQNPYQAIVNNFSLIDIQLNSVNQLLYPFTSPILENGKTYAWRISSKTASYDFGYTETWVFKYALPPIDSVKFVKEPFIVLSEASKGNYTTSEKKLYLQLDELYNRSTLLFKLYNNNNVEVAIDCDSSINTTQGDNRVIIDFNTCTHLPTGNYRLEVINKSGKVYSLRFKYE